jgi:hypothetical protein
LYFSQVVFAYSSFSQWFTQDVRRSNRILNRKIYSYATNWRHRVRRVADAEEARSVPFKQSIHLDCQQFYFIPIV